MLEVGSLLPRLGPRDETQVLRLGGRQLYPIIPPIGSTLFY